MVRPGAGTACWGRLVGQHVDDHQGVAAIGELADRLDHAGVQQGAEDVDQGAARQHAGGQAAQAAGLVGEVLAQVHDGLRDPVQVRGAGARRQPCTRPDRVTRPIRSCAVR